MEQLLAAGIAGLVLGVIAAILGAAELRHRNRLPRADEPILADVEGATDRVVTLSATSNVVCPAHGHLLVPDACRSCRFLAGEVQP